VRVAVVGAGLAGLGAAYFLLKKGFSVTIFDENGVGGGASGIPVGLCHPYVGRSGKPSKFSDEALFLTKKLLDDAEKTVNKRLADRSGILRVDWTPFEWYPDLKKVEEGVLISSGMTVFINEYVHALFASLKGVEFIQKKISSAADLEEFDQIVFAMGFGMKEFDLPVNFVKGQVLIGTTDKFLDKTLMKAKGHLSPIGEKRVQLGSTYEHHFLSDKPDMEIAKKELKEKLLAFFAREGEFFIDSVWAGVRVCVKEGYLPIVQKCSQKAFIFTGLGSRGLLYHAYYGRHLADLIG
jgi:glycine/D-amino acid oxidase-like deaminating enzyme